jgi:hypothetical protein
MFPSQSSLGERCPMSRDLLHSSFTVPGMRTPFEVLQRGPYGDRCPSSPEPSSTYQSPVDEPRARLPKGTLTERGARPPESSYPVCSTSANSLNNLEGTFV